MQTKTKENIQTCMHKGMLIWEGWTTTMERTGSVKKHKRSGQQTPQPKLNQTETRVYSVVQDQIRYYKTSFRMAIECKG